MGAEASGKPAITAIDLCCGVGGWSCAGRNLPIDFIGAFDRDHTALLTHRHNHGTPSVCCDLTRAPVDWMAYRGQVDLIVGGIPCETISRWRSEGMGNKPDDEELASLHELLDECLSIVKRVEPRWWVLEDVPGIIRHLPPLTPYRMINARFFSAQSRKRAYVGWFPLPFSRSGSGGVLRDCLRPGPYRLGLRPLRRRPKASECWTAGHHAILRPENPAPTICNISSRRDVESVVVDGDLRRQLEWQEGARLQGFPEDFVFIGSPTAVAKHVGQAIQIDIGRAILEAIVADAERVGTLKNGPGLVGGAHPTSSSACSAVKTAIGK